MIGGNGSYVEDQSKSVYHKKLSETEERAVVDWLHERGLEFFLGSYQDYLDARETFSDLKAGTWGGKDEEALFGDLGVKGIDKAHAIDVLLEHLNAKKADRLRSGMQKSIFRCLNTANKAFALETAAMKRKRQPIW